MSEKIKLRGRLVLKSIAPDDSGFIAALGDAQLLISGLAGSTCANFAFVNKTHKPLAYGGYTVFGKVALLRSCVVLPEYRGMRVGARLVTALISQLQGMGVARVFLLTEGADVFFSTLGFCALPREEAPESIARTEQFTRHCSDGAIFMMRAMDEMMQLELDAIKPFVIRPEQA